MSKRSIESQHLVNDGHEDFLIKEISKLIRSYDLYGVPPSLELLEGYRSATSTGYVSKTEDGREPLSLQFRSNQPFSILDSTEKFSQMGFGYTYFFYFTKFVVLLGLFPLAAYSITMLVWYSLGSECLDKSTLTVMREMSSTGKPLEALKQYYGHSPAIKHLSDISLTINDNKTAYDPIIEKFINLNCQLYRSDKRCQKSLKLNCSEHNYSQTCERLTIEIVADNYIKQICHRDWLSLHAAGNRLTDIYERSLFIDVCDSMVVVLGCLMVVAFYFVYESRKLVYKGWNPKIEELSVLICGMEEVRDWELEVKLKEAFSEHGLAVKQVNLCFDTEHFESLFDKLQDWQSKRALHMYKKGNIYNSAQLLQSPQSFDFENDLLLQDDKVLLKIATKISAIEKEIREYRESFRLGPLSKHFLGTAYVTFNSHQEKLKALGTFKTKGWLFQTLHPTQEFQSEPLHLNKGTEKVKLWMEDSSSPQDVIWRNISTSSHSKFYRKMFSSLLTLAIIIFNFWVILMIKFEGVRISETREDEHLMPNLPISYEMTVNLVIALVVFAINQIMRQVLKLLANFEKKNTYTARELMITHKLWKVQFVTAVFMPVGAAIGLMDTYGKNGLIYTMSAVLIVYVVLPPTAYMTLDVMLYFKMFMRWRIKGFTEGQNSQYITLKDAMKYWLKAEFVMSFGYSRVVRNLGIVMFLVPIMPIAVLFFVMMTFVFYWVNKYILVYRSNKLIGYSTKLCRQMIDELEICIGLFVCGIVFRDISSDYPNLRDVSLRPLHIFLGLLVFVLHYFNLKSYLKNFLPIPKTPEVLYSELINFDPNSYYLSNPAYDKQEFTMGRVSKRVSQSKLATHLTFFVKPVQDLYEIEDGSEKNLQRNLQLDLSMGDSIKELREYPST